MKRAIAAALALSLLGGTAAMAQPSQYHGDYQNQYQLGSEDDRYDDGDSGRYGDGWHDNRDDRYDNRDDRYDNRDDRRDDRRGNRYGHAYGHQYYNGGHSWRRGERLPREYRNSNYYVNDYRRYGLRQPPAGYQWMRAGNEYVLASLINGLIAQVLSNGYGR